MLSQLGTHILKRIVRFENIVLQRAVFRTLLEIIPAESLLGIVKSFIDRSVDFLSDSLLESMCDLRMNIPTLNVFFELAMNYCQEGNERYQVLFKFLAFMVHDIRFLIIRYAPFW